MSLSKQFYIDKILAARDTYHTSLQTAPSRPGWDPVFRKRIASVRQVEMKYYDTLRGILADAKMFGYDLQKDGIITLPEDEV